MAEFIFKDLLKKKGKSAQFNVLSRATSTEEIGNDIDFRAQSTMRSNGIDYTSRSATQFTNSDYKNADYIYVMDGYNYVNLKRMCAGDADNKIQLLCDSEVSDPWYTGNFQKAFDDILKGCEKRLSQIDE